jgi:type VI secretion system protein ImpH
MSLLAWLRFYSNGSYETEVNWCWRAKMRRAASWGYRAERRPQLGLVSWLKTRPLDRDPADANVSDSVVVDSDSGIRCPTQFLRF